MYVKNTYTCTFTYFFSQNLFSLPTSDSFSFKIQFQDHALAGVAQCTEPWPKNQRVEGEFPVRVLTWVVGQGRGKGHERQPHIDAFLLIFLCPLPSV